MCQTHAHTHTHTHNYAQNLAIAHAITSTETTALWIDHAEQPSTQGFFCRFSHLFCLVMPLLPPTTPIHAPSSGLRMVAGVPSCGNAWLLTEVLRSELGFEGHVVSDCSGVQDVSNRRFPKNATCLAQQGTTAPTQMNQTTSDCWCDRGECAGFPTAGDMATAAAAFNAGTDLDCGTAYQRGLADAMTANRVAAVQIDAALERLFVGRMKLGEFDPPERQPYAQIPWTSINSPDHQALALQAAREAVTLLKNNQATTRGAWNTGLPDIADTTGRHVLPLSRAAVKTVAVIGPNANCTLNGSGGSCNQLGNYVTFAPFVITPAAGIGQFAAVVGCEGSKISTRGPPRPADKQGFAQAAAQAGAADATVLVMGMLVSRDASQQPGAEGEGNDRAVGGVAIPQIQLDLVDHVANASAGKPVIVVVMSGAQLDLSPWSADPRISALLWVGYPGMMGGQAIAEVRLDGRGRGVGRSRMLHLASQHLCYTSASASWTAIPGHY